MDAKNSRPWTTWILIALLIFQSISAFAGGILMILNPDGKATGMDQFVDKVPFGNFILPGLILFIVLGVVPFITFIGLIRKKENKFFASLNVFRGEHHWSWAYSIYTGLMLIIWITVQVQMIGGGHILQTIYPLVGVAIVIAALLPPVKRWYSL
jgi:hypothetical protein